MDDILLPTDIAMLRKTIHSFMANEVTSQNYENKRDLESFSPHEIENIKEKARRAGLGALSAKKEWGGVGLSLLARVYIYEEASQHRFGMYHPALDAFGEELPPFLKRCTPEQIERFVKPAVKSGKGCYVALWELHEDTNWDELHTTAIKDGDEWLLNGHKSYVKKLHSSSFGVVLVHCLDHTGIRKPTLFLLDANDPIDKKEITLIDVQKVHQLSFHHVSIPDYRRIGEIGEGIELIKDWLASEQILLSARCLGVSKKALQYAKDYAKLRVTRGKPLAEYPSIQTMIAKDYAQLEAARLMVLNGAKKMDLEESDRYAACKMAKLIAIETASSIINDCLQVHGGAGFAGDLPIERWYKEIRLARLDLQREESIIEDLAEEYMML